MCCDIVSGTQVYKDSVVDDFDGIAITPLSLLAMLVTASLPHRLYHLRLGDYLEEVWNTGANAHALLAFHQEQLKEDLGPELANKVIKALRLSNPDAEFVPEDIEKALEDIKTKELGISEAEHIHFFSGGMDA